MSPRPLAPALLIALALGAGLGLAGCSGDAPGDRAAAPTKTPAPPVTLAMTLPKGGVDATLVRDAVTFTAAGGALDSVQVGRAGGAPLGTSADADGLLARWAKTPTVWRLSGVLGPKSAYRAVATGHNADGAEVSKTFTFTTAAAPLVQAGLNPGDDQVVGVGMPIRVRFSGAVPDRASVERHLKLRSTPAVPGAWGWTDDRTLWYRPKTFWPAGTKVDAAVDIAGAHLGRGVFGGTSRTIRFAVGRDLRMQVSDASHSLTVVQAGRDVARFPVSLGKPGHETLTGTKIVYEKASTFTMHGAAADPYVTTVAHAQRITDSGEFLHAAPWSVAAQGVRDVSHGCTNLSPSAASWLFGRTILGDPVVTTGTKRRMPTWDGMGGIWNYSWADWRKLSALPR